MTDWYQTSAVREADTNIAIFRLSRREAEILKLIGAGAPNKAIARDLGVAEATIKVHIKSLLRKMHVNNRTQAAIWAKHNGL